MIIRFSLMVFAMLALGITACSDKSGTSADKDTDSDNNAKITINVPDDSDKTIGAPDEGALDIAEGMIEYELGGMQSGTVRKYWRRHGLEIAEYHDVSTNIMGMVQTEKKWTIVRPDGIYNIDQASHSATKADNPGAKMVAGMDREQIQAIGKDMLEQMGQRAGTREIAGETCELWKMEGMGAETCLWKGLELYTSGGMGGMVVTKTAVKVNTGSVDNVHFEVPDTIQVRDMGNPMDWQQQMQRAQQLMQDK